MLGPDPRPARRAHVLSMLIIKMCHSAAAVVLCMHFEARAVAVKLGSDHILKFHQPWHRSMQISLMLTITTLLWLNGRLTRERLSSCSFASCCRELCRIALCPRLCDCKNARQPAITASMSECAA